MTEQNNTEKLTEESLFEKLVAIFNLIWDHDADVKDLLDQAKEDGVEDISLIKTIAKAKAYNKISDLEDKAKAQLKKIEILAG
jgi:hypothetical protein